jgi:hypothetical protein
LRVVAYEDGVIERQKLLWCNEFAPSGQIFHGWRPYCRHFERRFVPPDAPRARPIDYNRCFNITQWFPMIKGSIVAIVTPMHADGSLDFRGLRKLIDWHIAEGTDSIVIAGTTGESAP